MANRNQPTYDFLSHSTGEQDAQSTVSLPSTAAATAINGTASPSISPLTDSYNEKYRAKIHALQYELNVLNQEREVTALQHQRELRDLSHQAEIDFKRIQTLESNLATSLSKQESLQQSLTQLTNRGVNEKLDLEQKIRSLNQTNDSITDELEVTKQSLALLERERDQKYREWEIKCQDLESALNDTRNYVDQQSSQLLTAQQKIKARDKRISELEIEQANHANRESEIVEAGILRRELSEQIEHLRKLESQNSELVVQVNKLQEKCKVLRIAQEEKLTLESKLTVMDKLQEELADALNQRQILENERNAWVSYLRSASSSNQGQSTEFSSPEEMARAYMRLQLENTNYLQRVGQLNAELTSREQDINQLESSLENVSRDLQAARQQSTSQVPSEPKESQVKAYARLERHKNLAQKEIEYLRAQIKSLDSECLEMNPQSLDTVKLTTISQLENLLDETRRELDSACQVVHNMEHAEAKKLAPVATPVVNSTLKRSLELSPGLKIDADQRYGELCRKLRRANEELSQVQSQNSYLEAELRAKELQLENARVMSKTRILQLNDNPTSEAMLMKLSAIKALREENKILLQLLEKRAYASQDDKNILVVPEASLNALRIELEECTQKMANESKRNQRRLQIFTAKATEFREAVASILGWNMEFMPNGRVKLTSLLYPEDENVDRYVLFDGENATMKISGGPQSEFAREIRPLVDFWVDERKQIPCFLAAMTLEFYERFTPLPTDNLALTQSIS